MLYFTKSYETWSFYEKRDLIYKVSSINIYKIPSLTNFIITKKKTENEDIYSTFSSLILLFDQIPFLIRLKYSVDNKLKNTILGAKLSLNKLNFYSFFFRYKIEENLKSLQENLFIVLEQNNTNIIGIHIKQNLFDEFLILYDKFSNISDIFLRLNFINCKKKEEKKLLLSNLLLF